MAGRAVIGGIWSRPSNLVILSHLAGPSRIPLIRHAIPACGEPAESVLAMEIVNFVERSLDSVGRKFNQEEGASDASAVETPR
jgi:hypothetical protein